MPTCTFIASSSPGNNPHYARGLACTGDYDVVCCGHSHEASVIRQPTLSGGTARLVNPGTVAGLGARACYPNWV